MPAGISHFAIKVRDLAAAEAFYRGVLGLEIDRRWPNATGTGWRSVWVRTGDDAGTFLALESLSDNQSVDHAAPQARPTTLSEPPVSVGHYLLALRIRLPDRQACEERLVAAGVAITHRTPFSIYFTDPEGNRLALSHYPDSAENLPHPPAGNESTVSATPKARR